VVTFTIEAILAVLFVVVLMQFFKKRAPEPSIPQQDLTNLKPSDARTGAVISVAAAGDSMSGLAFRVELTAWIQAGSHRRLELAGHYRERRVALRAATTEDEVTVALNDGTRKLTLDDLGLSENDLAEIDERQNPADNFEFDGKVWDYRLSREAQVSSDGGAAAAGFYYWEFQEQGGKELLAIRKLEGEPFGVARYTVVPASDVTVYRKV